MCIASKYDYRYEKIDYIENKCWKVEHIENKYDYKYEELKDVIVMK